MAAFSYNNPALVDSTSFLFPNTPLLLPSYDNNNNDNIINNNGRICGFLGDINNSFPCFSQPFYPAAQGPLQEVSSLNVSSTTKVSSLSNSSSMVTDQNQNNMIPDSSLEPHKKRKSSSKFNSAQSKDTSEVIEKGKKQRRSRGGAEKKDEEINKNNNVEKGKEEKEGAPSGYIHVRARRGQATDSHSLAERVRREKISERMKMLQALVPGCDKVTGKALMLDEIINYVQSLQNQVEFLSMKLASMNPMFYDFGSDMETIMIKPESVSFEAQQADCSPPQFTTNTFTPANNYPLLDSSGSLLLQHGQMPEIPHQGNGQLSWDSNEHRQKIMSQSGFPNNLCSFH
ncbi:hypothetical protein DCAR_0624875 [Daucus carota subsp. sativus]|uniref:BHLH domain-containing protein n=1 Tax=Daucus carota subsp. sativus TaxID=79200 RepID=A0A164W358_DAUCS|nr:PREDICTED: transcription factor bHLH137-like [Daucus carota subsp. sativus]WOH05458.1 hypothetical protein DCAR_0624875 [Daucus carota subsp. sativus]